MKKIYNISYAIILLSIVIFFIFFQEINDMTIMLLAAFAIILTSIFTYSNRKK